MSTASSTIKHSMRSQASVAFHFAWLAYLVQILNVTHSQAARACQLRPAVVPPAVAFLCSWSRSGIHHSTPSPSEWSPLYVPVAHPFIAGSKKSVPAPGVPRDSGSKGLFGHRGQAVCCRSFGCPLFMLWVECWVKVPETQMSRGKRGRGSLYYLGLFMFRL